MQIYDVSNQVIQKVNKMQKFGLIWCHSEDIFQHIKGVTDFFA